MALLALGCVVLLLATSAPTFADAGPHVMGSGLLGDNCAACHRVHTAQAPDLLKADSVEALCYTCHGSSGAGSNLDVADGVGYPTGEDGTERTGTPEALRGGGFKYALIGSASPSGQQSGGSDRGGVVPVLSSGEPVTSAHSVNGSSQIAWGNGPISETVNYGKTIKLTCTSCHDPHGNGNYRILRGIPEESGASTEVNIPEAPEKDYTTTNYWDVEEEHDPAFLAEISAWCATCHTRYLSSTSYTDSGDAVFTDRHISDQTTQGSASCIQCHVAHGTDASVEEAGSMAVHSPEGVPAPPSSVLLRVDNRGTCRMCHTPAEE